jgi:hypothetical protein
LTVHEEDTVNVSTNNREQVQTGIVDCAGKGCRKKGIKLLEIKFIKKSGFFCDSCSSELLELGIATLATN